MCDVLKPPRHHRRSICVFYLVLRALDTVEDDMYAPLAPKLELLRSFHSLIATEQPSHLVIHGYGMTADERVLLTELPRLLRVLGALPPDQRHTIFSITERMGTVRGVALHLPKLSSV
jgi:farnesyl-diphosphate farnesyltransferase